MKAKVALKIVLTFLLVGGILYFVGVGRFIQSFREINPYLFLAALAGSPLVVFASSRKWMEIIKHEAAGISYSEALTSFLAGLSLGLLTPGRVGEFARPTNDLRRPVRCRKPSWNRPLKDSRARYRIRRPWTGCAFGMCPSLWSPAPTARQRSSGCWRQ